MAMQHSHILGQYTIKAEKMTLLLKFPVLFLEGVAHFMRYRLTFGPFIAYNTVE